MYFYNARFYDPALGRFVQADTLVPNPGNPQDLNRYSYGRNNPLTYMDDGGHLPIIPILIVGGIVALKAIDYGWTAYDAWQSLRVMNDPSASEAAKTEAAANLAMTAAVEAIEPDDILPVALPLDDLARKGVLKLGKEAGQEAAERMGKEAVEETTQRLIRHYLATNKNWIRDPRWSERFQKLFARGGMSLDDAANIMKLPPELAKFHKGPHSQAYHQWVYQELQKAIAGLEDPAQIRAALESRLRAIAEKLRAHPEWLRNPPLRGGR